MSMHENLLVILVTKPIICERRYEHTCTIKILRAPLMIVLAGVLIIQKTEKKLEEKNSKIFEL